MEGRRAAAVGTKYKAIPHGWCLEEESFRKELLAHGNVDVNGNSGVNNTNSGPRIMEKVWGRNGSSSLAKNVPEEVGVNLFGAHYVRCRG